MEVAGESREARSPEVTQHGLKSNAIGFRDVLIIGIASTAPAYSLAAVIGLVVTVGVQAPAVLLASFAPTFFVAMAFIGTYGESPPRSYILGTIPHKRMQFSETESAGVIGHDLCMTPYRGMSGGRAGSAGQSSDILQEGNSPRR